VNPAHIRLIVIISVIGVGVYVWDEFIKYNVIPKRWGVVEQGKIYRSGQLSSAVIKRTLKKHNIAFIVRLNGNTEGDKDSIAEGRIARELGIEVQPFMLGGDGTGDIRIYARAIEAVVDARKEGKPVLVHCAAGAQRTGAWTAFYRLLLEKRSADFVLKELKKYDWDPDDDQILVEYINDNMLELATILKEKEIIDEVPDPPPLLPGAADQ
jgi:protein tyrosine/serine phosphatase